MEINIIILDSKNQDEVREAARLIGFLSRENSRVDEPMTPVAPARVKRVSAKARANGRGDARQLDILSGTTTTAAPASVTSTGVDPDFTTPEAAARTLFTASKNSITAVHDVLAKFKVTRVSELSKEQGPDFIAAVQEALR
jgi:hypothetical protein